MIWIARILAFAIFVAIMVMAKLTVPGLVHRAGFWLSFIGLMTFLAACMQWEIRDRRLAGEEYTWGDAWHETWGYWMFLSAFFLGLYAIYGDW